MVVVVVGALLVGLSLGLCGSGGSILTVPVLRYVLHHPEKIAIAESLGIVCAIAAASATPYALTGLVEWPSVLWFGFAGMAGTAFGAWLADSLAGSVQLLLFAAVMLWAAWMMWQPGAANRAAAGAVRGRAVRTLVEGFGVGTLTGVVGVGGGFLIVPALVLLGGLPMRRAVGTSLVIIAMQSATGFWQHLRLLDPTGPAIQWSVVATFAGVGIAGALVGHQLGAIVPQTTLRRGFSVLLVLLGLFILGRETLALLGAAA